MLAENEDAISEELGYTIVPGAPGDAEPVETGPPLEWWAILLICVGGLGIISVMYIFYRNTRVDGKG